MGNSLTRISFLLLIIIEREEIWNLCLKPMIFLHIRTHITQSREKIYFVLENKVEKNKE